MRSVFSDFRSAAFWAGVTAFVWFAFGAVPLQVAVAGQLGLSAAETSSWIFIVWFGGAVSSIGLALTLRQPVMITWTIPGLVYLGTLAGRFTFAELMGANLIAALLIFGLGALGIGGRIMKWLPLPIVMGMFAGSILGYATRAVTATVEDMFVAGAAVAGYLLGRAIGNPKIPAVGVAVVVGALPILFGDHLTFAAITWSLPTVGVPAMTFSLSAAVAVSVPLVVLAMGLGNVQGIGFLLAQGYRVPVNRVSTLVGINSIVNALLGGHPATVSRLGIAILASPDAGPVEVRYWSTLVAAPLTIALAFAATPIASLITALPSSYVFVLAGLAIFSSLQDALEKSFSGRLRFGSLIAFVVAATPFAFAGITSAFWAIVAGFAGSMLAERRELLRYWQEQ